MISIKRTAWVAAAAAFLMLATVTAGLYLGTQTRKQFGDIAGSWSGYADDAEKKGVWISSLRGYLGYGGIIHNFKNYIIRRDEFYRTRMLDQLTQFDAVMASYLAEPLPQDERRALTTIRGTIDEYRANLAVAERAARGDWPAERTDRLVRVDDTQAILALQSLESIWRENRRLSTERIIAAVGRGESLIAVGFLSMALLVLSAVVLAALIAVLARDGRRAMERLRHELETRTHLERSQRLLAEVVEQSPATIIVTDEAGVISYVNRRFEEISGWTRDEVVGQTPRLLASEDMSRTGYSALWETLRSGHPWTGVFRNLRKDGSSYWVETLILPLRNPDGQIHSYVGIGEDITDKREARDQVARAQKLEAVGLLAGGLAHDFNNILTSIIGSAHLARCEAPPGSDLDQDIEQIEIGARRAQSLVRQLLAFARREPARPQPIELCSIIEEVGKLVRAAIPPTVSIAAPDRCAAVVMADPTHLHQVLMNLCTNAAEAIGDRNGTVRLYCSRLDAPPGGLPERPQGWVRLTVEDDGPGVPESVRSRIFDAFYTTKPLGKGSGLGLSVVQGLVDDMGGRVSVETSERGGARFSVWLPACDADALAQADDETALQRGSERIMLVDDQAEIAATYRRILTRLGYRVEAYSSAEIALKAFLHHPARVDLVISDVVMPEMSGPELASAMRRTRPDLPVILWTGYNPATAHLDGRPAAVLEKPVEPASLARAVRLEIDGTAAA